MIDTKKLRNDLLSPETDKQAVVDLLIVQIDEFVSAFNELVKTTNESVDLSLAVQKTNSELTQTVIDYTKALKNIHHILGVNNPEELNQLKNMLAKWVLAPATIKLGVVTNVE